MSGTTAEVIYRTKKALYPRFGFALPEKQIAYVRDDLPKCVTQFVIGHEVYHLTDNANGWAWREIKANMHSALRHPIGFMVCLQMSLIPYRLRYYLQRIAGRTQ